MSQQWSAPAWAVVVLAGAVLVVLLGLLLLAWSGRRTLSRVQHEAGSLLERVAELEGRLVAPAPSIRPTDQEFVITHLGDPEPPTPIPVVAAPVFADLVLRESAVRAATLTAGLRRALSPEARHRIRFEMRRELKRARKQRRADLRAARRDLHARERAAA